MLLGTSKISPQTNSNSYSSSDFILNKIPLLSIELEEPKSSCLATSTRNSPVFQKPRSQTHIIKTRSKRTPCLGVRRLPPHSACSLSQHQFEQGCIEQTNKCPGGSKQCNCLSVLATSFPFALPVTKHYEPAAYVDITPIIVIGTKIPTGGEIITH